MTSIFDSSIFDHSIFDCGTVEDVTTAAGGTGRPVQRGYPTRTSVLISGLLKLKIENSSLISGILNNPLFSDVVLSGSLIRKSYTDGTIAGRLKKTLITENDLSSQLLYRITKSEQVTGKLSRMNIKTLLAAALALDDDELLLYALTSIL